MNVKPGDLAIQIKSMYGNEGKICKVLHYIGPVTYWDGHSTAHAWECEYPAPVLNMIGWPVTRAQIPDESLRPISGLPDHDEVEDEQPIKEIA